jgi:ribosomal protein S18
MTVLFHKKSTTLFSHIKIADLKNYSKSKKASLLLQLVNNQINYKQLDFLKFFMTPAGKIKPQFQTGLKRAKQHRLAKAIRYARNEKLLPLKLIEKA